MDAVPFLFASPFYPFSILFQVLLSIQSMILISAPMYNEPGYDGIQGTPEGNVRRIDTIHVLIM